jgi:hypothetical protein
MALKTYYHGTVQAFLGDIKKNGLRPMASHSWKIRFSHYGGLVKNPDIGFGVYLAKQRVHAEEYAQTRADYFQRNPGECFEMYETEEQKKEGDYLFLSKDRTAPVLHTMPVLITLDLDPEKYDLQEDPEDTSYSLISHKAIPVSAITKITKLPVKYDTSKFDKKHRKDVVAAATSAMLGGSEDLFSGLMAQAVKKNARN